MRQEFNNMNRVEINDSKSKQTQKNYLTQLNKVRTDALKSNKTLEDEVSALGDIIKKNYLQSRSNNTLYSKQLIDINTQIGEGFTNYFNHVVDHETRMFALNREVLHPSTGGGYLRESYEKMYSSTKDEFKELFDHVNSGNEIAKEEATTKLLEMGINKKDFDELTKGFTGNQHDVNKLIQTLEERGHITDEASKREMKFQKDNADQMKTLMNGIGERQEKFTNSMEESGKKLFGGNEIGGVLGKTIGKNLSQINPFRMTEDNNGMIGSRLKKANMYLTNKAGGALSSVHAGGENVNKGIASLFTSKFAKKITSKGLQDRLEAGAFRENEKQDKLKHDRRSTRQAINEAFTGKSDTLKDTLYASNNEKKIQEEEDLVFSRMTKEQRKKAKRIKSVVPRDLLNSERENFDDSEQRTKEQAKKVSDLDKVVTEPILTPKNPSLNSGMGRMSGLPNESKLSFSSFINSNPNSPLMSSIKTSSSKHIDSNPNSPLMSFVQTSSMGRMSGLPNESKLSFSSFINSNPNSPLMSSIKTSSSKHIDSNPNSPLMSFVQTSSNQDPTLIDGKLMNENNKQQSIYYRNQNSNRKEDFGVEEKPEKKSLKDKVMDKVRSVKSSKENGGLLNKVKGMFMKSGGWIKTSIMSGVGFLKTAIMSGAGLIKSAALGLKGLAPKALSLGKQLITKSGGLLSSIGTTLMTDVAALGTGTVSAAVTAAAAVGLYSGKKIGEKVYSEETAEKLNIDKSFASDWQKNNSKFWSVDGFFNTQTWKDIGEGLVITSKESINELSGSISTLVDGEDIVTLNSTKELDKDQIKADNKKKIELSVKTADNTGKMVKNLENLNKNLSDIVNSGKQVEYMSDNVKGK